MASALHCTQAHRRCSSCTTAEVTIPCQCLSRGCLPRAREAEVQLEVIRYFVRMLPVANVMAAMVEEKCLPVYNGLNDFTLYLQLQFRSRCQWHWHWQSADRVVPVTGQDPIETGLEYRTLSSRVALLEPCFCVCGSSSQRTLPAWLRRDLPVPTAG